MYDLVIRSGTLVTPHGAMQTDLAIDGGKIAAFEGEISSKQEVDASKKLIFPGIIDAHTHMALPVSGTRSSDDFFTGTRAAACGGVTTIVDFTVGTRETTIIADIESRREAAQPAGVDYSFHAEVIGWNPSREGEIREAIALGVKTFKFYTAYATSGRQSDAGDLCHAFRVLAKLNGTALVHCEDEEIINSILNQMSAAERANMANLAVTRPSICEQTAISKVANTAKSTGAKVHIVHVSSGLGLAVVMRTRKQGAKLTAETCPQYLLLDSNVYNRKDGHLFSAAPPLRTEEDQVQLWEGLVNGALDLVATDHCPFTRKQKMWQGSFLDLPYGLPGVETLLPLLYSEGVVKGRIPITAIPRLLCEGPARINGLYPRKGTLSIGSDADLVIFDPKKEWMIHAKDLHMATDFSPYEGVGVRGAVEMTISRGRVVYADGQFQGERGWGQFIV
ncbi:MAG: dihydropyrimidinase [Candidatus Bipolaricaulota bacterium]